MAVVAGNIAITTNAVIAVNGSLALGLSIGAADHKIFSEALWWHA